MPKSKKTFNLKISCIQKSLNKLSSFMEEANITVTQAESRLSHLETVWRDISKIMEQSDETLETDRLSELEDLYLHTKDKIILFIQSSRDNDHGSSQPSVSQNHLIRLAPISIPNFSGKLENWTRFFNLFSDLVIKNKNLTNVQKMHYLISSLRGDALRLLENYDISDNNFELCWQKLIKNYHDVNKIAMRHCLEMIKMSPLKSKGLHDLKGLLSEFVSHIDQINALKLDSGLENILLQTILLEKLDLDTRKAWFLEFSSSAVDIKILIQFLEKRVKALELSLDSSTNRIEIQERRAFRQNSERNQVVYHGTSFENKRCPLKCVLCSELFHRLYKCPEFLKLTPDERRKRVKDFKYCFNCLALFSKNHACSSKTCFKCKRKHHSLLHVEENSVENQDSVPVNTASSSANDIQTSVAGEAVTQCTVDFERAVILPTAILYVDNGVGQKFKARALIDSGSMSNFISENLVQRLNLIRIKQETKLSSVNSLKTGSNAVTMVNISSLNNQYYSKIKCVILPRVSANLPIKDIKFSPSSLPKKLKLADPQFFKSGPVDMLLNCDVFSQILLNKKYDSKSFPSLINTKLGFVIAGSIPSEVVGESSCHFTVPDEDNKNKIIDEQLKSFWELEGISQDVIKTAVDPAELHFEINTVRLADGRFQVSLPFKQDPKLLGKSYNLAKKRFLMLEKRFAIDNNLKKDYTDFIEEYIKLGHATRVGNDIFEKMHYFIPHFAVRNPNSSTTPLRVVFDASAPTSSGVAINDLLMAGPPIQRKLMDILLEFRVHIVAFCADVKKMYRQVNLNPNDRIYQLILWRKEPRNNLEILSLNTLTYGFKSSSFGAVRCLWEMAKESQEVYPQASNIIKNNFYVDDLLTGSHDVDSAVRIAQQVSGILARGQFPLTKWASNSLEFLSNFSKETLAQSPVILKAEGNIKTLGLKWNPREDTLSVCGNLEASNVSSVSTKRKILSAVSMIFDPNGLLSPVTIRFKLFIQKLWRAKLPWDGPIEGELQEEWKELSEELRFISKVVFPRCVIPSGCSTNFSLHCYTDASPKAYGCVIYVASLNGKIETCNLLCSKTRIAPCSQRLTIPRLELCGAVLLVKLVKRVRVNLPIPLKNIYLYTDSTIVLSWIKNENCKTEPFVSHRVQIIRNLSKDVVWMHVKGAENPADLLTRGMSVAALNNSMLWRHGPSTLGSVLDTNNTNNNVLDTNLNYFVPVSKVNLLSHMLIDDTGGKIEGKSYFIQVIEKFSSYNFLIRVIAYCLRFVQNCKSARKKETKNTGPLTVALLNQSLILIVKEVQLHIFHQEIKDLKSDRELPKCSKLLKLFPFIDGLGLMRVGGRLQNSSLTFEEKHPIILTHDNHFSELIARAYHLRYLHAGPQLLSSAIKSKFWIISLSKLVKRVTNRCLTCFRLKKETAQQLMGELPVTRVTPSPPFSHVSVDFTGPLNVRMGLPRSKSVTKAYIAVFICHASKAVCIDLIESLSTKHFIACLTRFSSRFGFPKTIMSENARTFIKASKDINEFINFISKKENREKFESSLSNHNTQWIFCPAYSPHRNSLVEAAVKSLKYHLRRTLGQNVIYFQELRTLLSTIEACLNSRPLFTRPGNDDDVEIITPQHLITGHPLKNLPFIQDDQKYQNPMQRCTALKNHLHYLWKRWSADYLSVLQNRSKWQTRSKSLMENDLVILKDSPVPFDWKIAKIIRTFPDKNGLIRTIQVKTPKGTFIRAIQKVCLLPKE